MSLRLDPWAASSLLQKAIRRGEVELAQSAAAAFRKHRGAAIWRRLATIAVEDIGIGDIGLVSETARLATDNSLRNVVGSETDLIDDLCARLASAVKDRSADYLYSAATLLPASQQERTQLAKCDVTELIDFAADELAALPRRAVAAVLACSIEGAEHKLIPTRIEELLSRLGARAIPLDDAVLRLARARLHPFLLMLPLIWSRWWHCGARAESVSEALPAVQMMNGVPTYAYDKHTAVGKQAIARFARENRAVARVLSQATCPRRSISVAEMAAFYADAIPVGRRLKWAVGSRLHKIGCFADMMNAGCSFEGVAPVLDAVRQNLPHLDELRRSALQRREIDVTRKWRS